MAIVYFFLFKKKTFKAILPVIVAAIVAFRSYLYFKYKEDYFPYFDNTFCRMDSFIIGGAFYFLSLKPVNKIFKYIIPFLFLIICISVLVTTTKNHSPFMSTIGYTLLAIFFGSLVLGATQVTNNYLKHFLNQKWLIYFGKISYGLYIFHWIILRFLEDKFIHYTEIHFRQTENISLSIALFVCLGICILISHFSYFYFEQWFLKRKVY